MGIRQLKESAMWFLENNGIRRRIKDVNAYKLLDLVFGVDVVIPGQGFEVYMIRPNYYLIQDVFVIWTRTLSPYTN